jgi:O-antigen ligase
VKLGLRGWGIVALGAGLPIPYAVPWLGAGTGSLSVDLFVWPLLVGALVLTGSREWVGLRRDVVARLLLAFLIVSALSLPIGMVLYNKLDGPKSFAFQVVLMLNFGAGYLILRTLGDIDLLIRAFVASIGAFSLALSIYLLQAGILGSVHSFHNSSSLMTAIYGWPNGISVLAVVGLVMCMYVIATAKGRLVRGAYLVFAIGLGTCLILTFSKTGWVAVAVALWLLWLRFWTIRRQVLLLAGVAAALAVLLYAANASFRMQIYTIGTLEVRLRFVAVVLDRINPLILLTGSGSQSLVTLTRPFADVQLVPGVTVGGLGPQNEFLNVLVKSGVVGLALLVAALVIIMLRTRRLKMSTDDRVAQLFRFWFATSSAIVVSLFAVEGLRYWPLGAIFWLIAGAKVHLPQHTELPDSPVAPPEPDPTRNGRASRIQ